MKKLPSILFACSLMCTLNLFAQKINFGNYELDEVNVTASLEEYKGKKIIKVIKSTSVTQFDEPTFARVKDIEFSDGIIEVKVLSRLLPGAPELARGFIGIAFRINDSNSKYESIYIRPSNGRAEEQIRRNHSIQYYSYPAYKFDRLRKEAPGEYEAYADMGLNEWINIKIEVEGTRAKLFLNDGKHPSLVVNDLKHGADLSGAIGLRVDVGTEGFFSELRIQKK